MKVSLTIICLFILFLIGGNTKAQQLSYKAVNPNFGGNYLNYSWLMASADAQNPFNDQDTSLTRNNSAVSGFSESVKRQILNQLTRGLTTGNGQNGETGLEPGTTEIGGLVITIENTRSGTIITIIDTQTGETTEIII